MESAASVQTFVYLLVTSHYGQPETLGLTPKPFATPLGTLEVDTPLAERAGMAAVRGGLRPRD